MKITIDNLKKELSKSFNGDLESITLETVLKDIVDSLDMLDFYMNLEESYEIQIPDDDVEKLKTLNDFSNYLEKRVNEI